MCSAGWNLRPPGHGAACHLITTYRCSGATSPHPLSPGPGPRHEPGHSMACAFSAPISGCGWNPGWRAGVMPRTLPATLLAAAPAFLEPLHEAEPGLLPRAPAALGVGTAAALATLATGRGGLRAGHAKALAAHNPAHVPPAGQRPHRTCQHDEEPAHADKD